MPRQAGETAARGPEFIAPRPNLPYSQAVRVGDTVYLAGMLGTTEAGLVGGGIQPETRQTLENIRAPLPWRGAANENLALPRPAQSYC